MNPCFTHLSMDIVKHILGYHENIVIRGNKIIYIGKIASDDPRIQVLLKRPLIKNNRVTFPLLPTHRPGILKWFVLVSTREIDYNEETDEVDIGHHVIEFWKLERTIGSHHNRVLSMKVTYVV